MEFKEVLYRAKEMDDTATLQIMEMFRPLLLKYDYILYKNLTINLYIGIIKMYIISF